MYVNCMTFFVPISSRHYHLNDKEPHKETLIVSGWQDSNLRPPAPKAGALTGLRYTPYSK